MSAKGLGRSGIHMRRSVAAFLVTVLVFAVAATGVASAGAPAPAGTVSVIVRALPGAGSISEYAVQDVGGTVTEHLDIIDAVVADVPAGAVGRLIRTPGIFSVTPNTRVHFLTGESYDPNADPGSMVNVAEVVHARELWDRGITGKGVDVALVDTGVVPVDGLTTPDKVVNGPDLSFESQSDGLRYLDTFGHGTHMAGIIAGKDPRGTAHRFLGIAPNARIVSIKVADAAGAADISQVIAAIDWVVQHRQDNGLNIRVLNLSFGVESLQPYVLDPLSYAAEVAWRQGIVVVVAAGNSGDALINLTLANPAQDPFVIAVGADDTRGTYDPSDDVVPGWSTRGNGVRNPDVVAPGRSIVSLRDPGSYIDQAHPEGYVNERFFRGSGTSQAAAVVSGAAALLLEQRPNLTPDQVKALLKSTAEPLRGTSSIAQGDGLINLLAASRASTPSAHQSVTLSSGLGSLELSRGNAHLADSDGNVLVGEQDIFGTFWNAATWSVDATQGDSWSGGWWRGDQWAGDGWGGSSWTGKTWSGKTWSADSWSGKTWSAGSWTGKTWSGKTWSDGSWDGKTWSGKTWSGKTWSGKTWSEYWGTMYWGIDLDPLLSQLGPVGDFAGSLGDTLGGLLGRLL